MVEPLAPEARESDALIPTQADGPARGVSRPPFGLQAVLPCLIRRSSAWLRVAACRHETLTALVRSGEVFADGLSCPSPRSGVEGPTPGPCPARRRNGRAALGLALTDMIRDGKISRARGKEIATMVIGRLLQLSSEWRTSASSKRG
jgi:hypothetical protein